MAEVTQSEIAQKQKLQTVLERINDSLKLSTRNIRWNVDCKGSSSLVGSSLSIGKTTICKKKKKSGLMEVFSKECSKLSHLAFTYHRNGSPLI